MKPISESEDCIRVRVVIDGEHYYIIQSKDTVHVTVPYENSPVRAKERKSVDILCQTVLDIANGKR